MNFIKEFLKGILIGVANIIPGVSGGTMAVSMGVYDKIIMAITGFRKNFKKSILTLLPYVIGAASGIGILSFVVKYALSTYPMQTSGLFIGLIIGGIPILVSKVKGARLTAANILVFIIFFCIVTGMAFLNGNAGSSSDIRVELITVIQLFFVGIIASATMIIPGVSGSLVMMILGFYGIIISNISNFISSLFHSDIPALIHGFGVLFPFGLGVLAGIGLVAKLIEILFTKVPVLTYFAIFGLIFGSPIAIIYKIGISSVTLLGILVTILTFCIGFSISFFLGKEEPNDK
ncbi:DUF368 domain-containing protein [Anaerocolumna sp. MB42-C2]|uniref:DUF368 domain-containing protein n=1 Tax=Anaerocolumna sp. MB42-C2 TaxID=3070997 RepID=UPI0027E1250C|nr:DUF368 domain-containing protein [Anaerocolumna sp. MB42-C2]WMJ87028.1 DUF368 domain-containing protein [Anaerocolumna sp. MB42-C2]